MTVRPLDNGSPVQLLPRATTAMTVDAHISPSASSSLGRRLAGATTLAAALALSGCGVVAVAGATAGAAISITGAVVSTGVKVTGKVIEKTIDVVTPSSGD
jgi:Ethanolamine utilization protein EutJ (predicted chaperonin)